MLRYGSRRFEQGFHAPVRYSTSTRTGTCTVVDDAFKKSRRPLRDYSATLCNSILRDYYASSPPATVPRTVVRRFWLLNPASPRSPDDDCNDEFIPDDDDA